MPFSVYSVYSEVPLQNPPDGVGAVGGKDLFKVGGDVVVGKAAVAQDGVGGSCLGDGFDHIIGHILIETGDQEVSCHFENLFAGNNSFFDLAVKSNAEFQHHLEQQIFRGTVRLDVADQTQQIILRSFVGGVIYIFHIGAVQFQHSETDIQIGSSQSSLFYNFFTGTADAFFANFC